MYSPRACQLMKVLYSYATQSHINPLGKPFQVRNGVMKTLMVYHSLEVAPVPGWIVGNDKEKSLYASGQQQDIAVEFCVMRCDYHPSNITA